MNKFTTLFFLLLTVAGCRKNQIPPLPPPCIHPNHVAGTYIGERYEYFTSTLTDTLYTDTIQVSSMTYNLYCTVRFSDFFPDGSLSPDYQLHFNNVLESGYFFGDSILLERCEGGFWNNCQIASYFKGKKQ